MATLEFIHLRVFAYLMSKFQIHLEDQIPFDPELHNGMAIDMCVENFSGAVLKALVALCQYHSRPSA